jgi:hypothetical protein
LSPDPSDIEFGPDHVFVRGDTGLRDPDSDGDLVFRTEVKADRIEVVYLLATPRDVMKSALLPALGARRGLWPSGRHSRVRGLCAATRT